MADTGRIRLFNLWLNENKTWLVKLWFQIPEWYVMSVEEENKLFNYIITERERTHMPRDIWTVKLCATVHSVFFCSEVSDSCKSCSSAPRAQYTISSNNINLNQV